MAIALVQQAFNSMQTGTSLVVTLPSAPTPGNVIVVVEASAAGQAPGEIIASAVTMTGVTFGGGRARSYDTALGPTVNMLVGYPITVGAGNQVVISLLPFYSNKPLVAFVGEYSGLKKDAATAFNVMNRWTWKKGDSNIAAAGPFGSPTSYYPELIVAGIANLNGATEQTVTTGDLTRVDQVSTDPAGSNSDVNLSIYDQVTTAIIPGLTGGMQATLEASHRWVSWIIAYLPDTSVPYEQGVSIDAFIIDSVGLKYNDLSVTIGEENLMPVSLNVVIDPVRTQTAGLVVGIEADQRKIAALNLDVVALADNTVAGGPLALQSHAITFVQTITDFFIIAGNFKAYFPPGMVFIVTGSTGNDGTYTVGTSLLSLGSTVIYVNESITDGTSDGIIQFNIGASFFASVPMDVSIVQQTDIEMKLGVLIAGGLGIELKAGLDVAVLAAPVSITSFTTPEDNRYITCRPRWCGVPKQYSSVASMNVSIVAVELAQVLLDLWITDTTATGVPTVDLEPVLALPVGAFAITDVDTGSDYFVVTGDLRRGIDQWRKVTVAVGAQIRVKDSTANDGLYDVDNITFSGGETYLYVVQAVPSSTTDGYVEIQQGKTFAAMDILIDGERSV